MEHPAPVNGSRIDHVSVPETLEAALGHHQAGRLGDAEALYRRILKWAPETADALHLLGVVHIQRGDGEKAVRLIRHAITLNGNAAAFHNNLGNALKTLARHEEATESYRRAVTLEPSFADAHNNLGTMMLDGGALQEAETSLRRAMSLAPGSCEIHFNLGLTLRKMNRLDETEASFRKALEFNPQHVDARSNLGSALLALGRPDEAHKEAERAVRDAPQSTVALTTLGNVFSVQQAWDQAEHCYRRAIATDPGHAPAHNNLGHALAESGKSEEAVACFQKALSLDPTYADAQNNLGSTLFRLERLDAAGVALSRAIRLTPDNAEPYCILGQVYERQGRVEEAERAFRKAISLKDDLAQAHVGLGNTFMVRGRMEETEACYRRAINHKVGLAFGYYGLSRVKRFSGDDPDLAEMIALAEKEGLPDKQDMHLQYALAKAYEDLRDYDRAFAALKRANAIKRRELDYDTAEAEAHYRTIEETFSADFLDQHANQGDPSELPIFILGMPRSGTTLVEQILSSHPDVHGAGELPDLVGLARSLPGLLKTGTPYPACLNGATALPWQDLGAQYVAGLRQRAPGAGFVTDKLPENHQKVGLISLILPRARIIHCRRDPVDTCLSNYKLLFTTGQRFTYDLRELGRQYRYYDHLMDHWARVLPDRVMEVRYEEMVADQENQTRRLLAHCGLDWDDACLNFHEADRKVLTASATQVRQPIYKDSVQKWRRYEAHLGPLLEALGDLVPA
ncbi:MAG: tetratricopeptide repeat protein [Kiloniellales bacterium]